MNSLPSLEKTRKNIDKLDSEILLLLKKRIELAKRAGQKKKELNLPIIDHAREAAVLSRAIQEAEKIGLDGPSVKRIFQEIISTCERVQIGVKVAFLGPSGTFCEQAAYQHFGSSPSYLAYRTINDVFRAVLGGEADYGVVPVENSLEGSVHLTLDLLLESNLCVCGETELQIRHNLLAKQGTKINEIKQLFSHPQAFAQCRRFLEENLPQTEKIEVTSTARAVEMIRGNNQAAIGTELAAKIYNVEILAKNVEDNPNNFTRFFILGHKDHTPTSKDKTSIIFSVHHKPGALYRAMKCFASRKLNLTRIESRPIKGKPWEYVFYLDFEGHRCDPKCQEALEDLKKKSLFLKVIGSYPKAR